ncbi:MAG: hypothetical protein KF778_16410 [Rhodocyclaceae bacterium]|nr:hypothetical protein [Rhodocyclaceae bacterium]
MLTTCYQELAAIVSGDLEPLEAAKCVESHRLCWRPEVVHTVLLAESHVYTPAHELSEMTGPHNLATRPLPKVFARFVYCLGYGEPEFAGPDAPRTVGTPQYWKLFASCAAPGLPEAFAPVLKGSNRRFLERIRAKLLLLERLRSLGVWLVDASAVGLYATGGDRIHQAEYEKVLRCCWRNYSGKLVREATPHSVVVIGKAVARVLHRELSGLPGITVHCVPQPQARCTAREVADVHATLFKVCQQAALARGAQ